MNVYHKTSIGDNGHGTSHPEQDMDYAGTLSHKEFRKKYGADYDSFGEFVEMDGKNGRIAQVGARLVRVHESEEEGESVEVWEGTAFQDIEGYRYESE